MKSLNGILLSVLVSYQLFAQELPIFKVQGDELHGLTPEREQRMKKAIRIFEKVMNDKNFQKEISEFPYQYDVPNDPNRTLTPQQVVTKIFDGQEFYLMNKDNIANLHWFIKKKKRPIFSRHPAKGYGNPSEVQIYTYTWFFDEDSNLASIVGHIAHEWSHKIGFDHLFKSHVGRENTVPYAFGDIVSKYVGTYLQE